MQNGSAVQPKTATATVTAQDAVDTPSSMSAFETLKGRIREHYEKCSDYYLSLWGEHIHHGYFQSPSDTKEAAQTALIELLLSRSGLDSGSTVLDVGCGVGGTSRYLARERDCHVTGVTISGAQVGLARELAVRAGGVEVAARTQADAEPEDAKASVVAHQLGTGSVRFIELDAEKMGQYFRSPPNNAVFDAVWISEAMSHLPNKALFFRNAFALLREGGKLVVADWFKAEDLTEGQTKADIRPIEDGMLLPPLCTQAQYVAFATQAGLRTFSPPLDISDNVAKTWDISISLVASPSLWALALSQGRDFVAFLHAFQAMRRGYANGTFRYAVMVFQK